MFIDLKKCLCAHKDSVRSHPTHTHAHTKLSATSTSPLYTHLLSNISAHRRSSSVWPGGHGEAWQGRTLRWRRRFSCCCCCCCCASPSEQQHSHLSLLSETITSQLSKSVGTTSIWTVLTQRPTKGEYRFQELLELTQLEKKNVTGFVPWGRLETGIMFKFKIRFFFVIQDWCLCKSLICTIKFPCFLIFHFSDNLHYVFVGRALKIFLKNISKQFTGSIQTPHTQSPRLGQHGQVGLLFWKTEL